MPDAAQWILSILGAIKVPLGATSLLAAARGIGAWLEKEADSEWKEATRSFLKSGSWIRGSISALSAANALFDRIYGRNYFSLLAMWRCVILTVSVSVALIFWQSLIYSEGQLIILTQFLTYAFYLRLAVSVPFD